MSEWCTRVTAATGVEWKYRRINQLEFDGKNFANFASAIADVSWQQRDEAAQGAAMETADLGNVVPMLYPKSIADAFQSGPPQLLKAAEPEAPPYEAPVSSALDAPCPDPSKLDREDLICRIRQLFGDGEQRERDAAIDALARELGYQRTGAQIHEELDNALRTAVRRGVLVSEFGALCVFVRARSKGTTAIS